MQGDAHIGQLHRADKASASPRHQEELADVGRLRWRGIVYQYHEAGASPADLAQQEQFGGAFGFDGERVLSRRNQVVLPMHFVGKFKGATRILNGSQNKREV